MLTPAFSLSRISFAFPNGSGGSRVIFRDFDLDIRPAIVTAFMGSSGAGKSTLAKLIAGDLIPDGGAVKVNPTFELPRDRFYINQDPRRVSFPWKSVARNISQPLEMLKWSRTAIDARVQELITLFELSDHVAQFPNLLSGGEKSRVALARILSWYPRAVFLDEYLAHLDGVTRARVIDALRMHVTIHGMTVVMISHDAADVAALADRCVVLGGSPTGILFDIDVRKLRAQGGFVEAQHTINDRVVAQSAIC